MQLRVLKQKDAPYMLEWMHDPSVVKDLQTDFSKKRASDCESFIERSQVDTHNCHMAIVDDTDEYMGTVSLKNIENSTAEFAITVRSCAMGKGYSKFAMDEIITVGFDELNLTSIYWCVSPDNKRAVRFYDKNNYHRVSPDTLNIRGGVQRRTDSQVLLVSHYKRGKEEQSLRIRPRTRQLNMDILFLRPAA